jgi:LysW-gamma-L-lysine carboxypeptidase
MKPTERATVLADAERLLQRLVDVPSPTGAARMAVELLVAEAQRLGFRAHEDHAGNFVAQSGTTGPHVAFVGHVDTVPGQIPVRVEGRTLWGRGSVDAKAPLVAFLSGAAKSLDGEPDPRASEGESRGLPRKPIRLTVVGTVDEEGPSDSVRALQLDPPDAIVVGEPSGWNGVTLGYKGTAKLHVALTRDLAHGSRPEPTAAEAASDLWSGLRELAAKRNPGDSPFTTFSVSLRNLTTTSDGLTDTAALLIDARVPVGFEVDAFTNEAREVARAAGAALEVRNVERPVRVEPNSHLVRALVGGIRANGGDPAYKLKAGTSDMAFLLERYKPRWGICAYGPGDASLDHTPEERIDLDEFARGIAVVEHALGALLRAKDNA